MTNNQILVQNIETFETITTLTVDVESGETQTERIDQYFSKNDRWGIVSLEDDADGEYMAVMLVAAAEGPDYDVVTNEAIPSAEAELEAKMDIMMELDMEETITIPAAPQPRKQRKTKTPKTNTLTKGKTMKNHEILAAFISANPNCTRTTIFNDAGLQASLREPAQVTLIASGDKLEVKRWNSCINRFIRKIKRDGVDIIVTGQGKTATYLIGQPDGQLELPFNEAAEARNAAIIRDDSVDTVEAPKVDSKRAEEAPNQNLSFESLLAQLDEDEATVTSDDQVAFEAAQKMIK